MLNFSKASFLILIKNSGFPSPMLVLISVIPETSLIRPHHTALSDRGGSLLEFDIPRLYLEGEFLHAGGNRTRRHNYNVISACVDLSDILCKRGYSPGVQPRTFVCEYVAAYFYNKSVHTNSHQLYPLHVSLVMNFGKGTQGVEQGGANGGCLQRSECSLYDIPVELCPFQPFEFCKRIFLSRGFTVGSVRGHRKD